MMKAIKKIFAKKNGVSTYGQVESMLIRRGDMMM